MAVWGAYRDYWWFDNTAHLLGGVAVGSVFVDEDARLSYVLAATVGVSTLWEGFEAWRGIYPWSDGQGYDSAVEDTILDSVFVLLGAAFVDYASRPREAAEDTSREASNRVEYP